jgi:nucleotide-binding universal stress UspA family protein
MMRRIVVGFDGSPAAVAAVAWAAREARLRGAELVAWTVLDRPESRHASDSVAAKTRPRSIEESAVDYPVTVGHGYGDAAAELVAACADADLLVVGSRGRGPLEGLLLGSVSHACLAHAPCPVVVLRPQLGVAASHKRVIVGVDGSEHSRQALRVAAEEARLRGAALHVLHAVHWDNSGEELLTPTNKQLVEWGRKLVLAELAATGVTGRPVVVDGHASEVLVRRSAHADLLVVGSRGRNPVTNLLLGSTSENCARHAHCPVMVNRARQSKPSGRAHVVVHGVM